MSKLITKNNQFNPSSQNLKEQIQNRLIEIISQVLDVKNNQIDIHQSLSSFHFDSMELIILTSELENYLGHELSLIFINDYPNIEILAKCLSEEVESLI